MYGAGDLFGGPRQLAATPDNDAGWQPPGGMPHHSSLRYCKDMIACLVMLIALPWLLWALVTKPQRVLSGAGVPH